MLTRLKVVRMTKGLRQADLAKQAGVSTALITQIENGRAVPSIRTLQAFARVLNVSLSDLAVDYEPVKEAQ